MKTHNIKLNIAFCDDVLSGIKPFEIRENDRGYQTGDHIKFIPYDSKIYPTIPEHPIANKEYEITYVLNGWGLKNGYVVFGIRADTERHAHWIFQSETSSAFDKKYKCSKCNRVIVVFDEKDLIHYPYCNCGCKMDEVTGNE